ncbi:MAG: hypothetical protein IJC48_09920 [Clostridia bacterium]|nr:hypothetical protein [Clostridia bacterium]
MDKNRFLAANALLENVTPLKTDCGLLCDHACCKPDDDAGYGVWLFPEEEAINMPWGTTVDTLLPVTKLKVKMLICEKGCERSLRPFQCRIFPLVPYFSKKRNEWDVRMDRRAFQLCPLLPYGKKALNPEFVKKAKEAVQFIAQDENGERFLQALAREEDAYHFSL